MDTTPRGGYVKKTCACALSIRGRADMEVFVSAPSFRFSNFEFPDGSVVGDVLNRFVQDQVSPD